MASITVRNIDKNLKKRLRVQAAEHGRSMEEEVRNILRAALSLEKENDHNMADFIRSHIEPLGGIDLPEIPREKIREPVNFKE